MNLQQLRYVREIVRRDLNITEAANALFTSQPGVSKQIKELEDELGVEIFVRRGRRFVGLTEPGKAVVAVVERMLVEAENLKRVGREFADKDSGGLVIATTHTQARYALPQGGERVQAPLPEGAPVDPARVTRRRSRRCWCAARPTSASPPSQLAELPELVALPCYQWNHASSCRRDHPLARPQAADARGPGAVSDRHLQLRVHRPLAHRAGLRRARPAARRGADRDRLRRDQDLRGAGAGRGHHRGDGLRSEARPQPARCWRRVTCSRATRPAWRCAAACCCAATSTTSSSSSRRN